MAARLLIGRALCSFLAARLTTVSLDSVTVLLEFMTSLLEYLDFLNGIAQSVDFPTTKALLSPQNASIIPDSHIPIIPEIMPE